MVMKVVVRVSNTESQVFGPGYDRVWSTVRKEGTASQLIANFLDTTKQIAASLEDNTASVSEEIAVTQFLVELGAVMLEVLPLCTDSEKPNETQENITTEERLPKTAVPQVDNQQSKESQQKEDVSKKENNQNEEDKTDKVGFNNKGEPADKSEVKIDAHSDSISEDASDASDIAGPDDNSSDTDDYEVNLKEQLSSSNNDDVASTSSTRRCSSRLQEHPRKRWTILDDDDSADEEKMMMTTSDKTFSCLLQLCSAKFSSRNRLLKHLTGPHKYDNEKAKEVLQEWYKPLKPGRPKRRKPLDDGDDSAEEKKAKMTTSDKPFSCMLQLCSAKFSSRNRLLKHLTGPHKYDNDKAIEVLQEWYKPLKPGRPKRPKPHDDGDDSAEEKKVKMEVMMSYKTFSCKLCSAKFKDRRPLIKHLMVNHKYTNDQAVETVREWHKPLRRGRSKGCNLFSPDVTKKPFVCSICKAGYPRRMLLKSHLCEMHGFTKETSDAEIATVYGVLRSRRRPKLPDSMFYSVDIKFDGSSNTQDVNSKEDVSKATGTKPTCPKCGKEFDRVSNARVHFENDCTNNPLECNICGSNFESIYGYKLHMAIHDNKEKGVEYKCQTCDKVVYHKYMLTQHEATHESKFICDFCGKSYPQNCLLQRHRNKHTKEKTFACPKCPQVFWLKHRFKRHIANVHEGNDESIACHVCGKMVKQCSMKIHISNMHSHFDYITCPIEDCGKAFKRQSYLDDHMKEVHEGGGGDEYPCTWPNCGKVFVRKKSLKTHMDVHNDVRRFSCTLCDKKFRAKNHLMNHTNWHQGIRPHKCQLCEKSFLTRGNLTKHMVTHKKRASMSSVPASNDTIMTLQAMPKAQNVVLNVPVEIPLRPEPSHDIVPGVFVEVPTQAHPRPQDVVPSVSVHLPSQVESTPQDVVSVSVQLPLQVVPRPEGSVPNESGEYKTIDMNVYTI